MSDYIVTNYNKHRTYLKMVQSANGQTKIKKAKKRKLTNVKKAPVEKNPTRHYYLYALALEDGFYYVGMTAYKDAVKRYRQHVAGKGSRWTKLHKPLNMIEVRDIGTCTQKTALEAENLMTRELMHTHGMYKVRGGDLCYVKDAMVALHFNDNGVKTVFYDPNGRRMRRSHKALRRREKQLADVQQQIADDLSWIA